MFKLYLGFCVILNINYIFFVWFKKIYSFSLVAPLLVQFWIRHLHQAMLT
jgi:hypothetical protein